MGKLSFLILVVLGLTLFSCEESFDYQKAYSFENQSWSQKVKPVFKFEIKDTTKVYDVTFTFRTTTDYKYSNFWMFWSTTTPDGKKTRVPYEIKVAHPDGSWVGDKTGTIVENSIYFKNRKFPLKGMYQFEIEQGVTEAKIDDVMDIALIFQEVKKP